MTSIHDFYSRRIHIYRRNIFTLKANQDGATMINQKMKQNKKQANPQNKNRKLILQFVFVFIAEMTWLQQFKCQRQVMTNSTTFSNLTLCQVNNKLIYVLNKLGHGLGEETFSEQIIIRTMLKLLRESYSSAEHKEYLDFLSYHSTWFLHLLDEYDTGLGMVMQGMGSGGGWQTMHTKQDIQRLESRKHRHLIQIII